MSIRRLYAEELLAAARFLPAAWATGGGAQTAGALAFAALWANGLFSPHNPWRLAAIALVLVAAAVVEGGLYRLALGKGRPGAAGFGWGPVENRLLIVWGLSALFLAVLAMLAAVVVLAFAFAAASAGRGFVVGDVATWAKAVDERGRVVVTTVGVLAFGGLLWASVKIALGAPVTIDEGRVQVLAVWPRARGLMIALLLGRGAVAGVAAASAAIALACAAGLPGAAGAWLGGVVVGAGLFGLCLPFNVGLMAYLHKHSGRGGGQVVGS
jgi:hypothetical protein